VLLTFEELLLAKKVGSSLGDENQTLNRRLFELPVSVAKKLANLREILGVQFCCPEFLFNKKGELTLIDINPCGDWYGFFPEERSREIASAIANVL
jgi:hypothetical protein